MSDSDMPSDNPEADSAPEFSAGGPVDGSPRHAESPPPSTLGPQSTDRDSGPTIPQVSRSERLGRVKQLASARKAVWAAAVLCVAVGAVGSVLRAQAVARTDAAEPRQAFSRTSAGLDSTLKLAIQHEEDLISQREHLLRW